MGIHSQQDEMLNGEWEEEDGVTWYKVGVGMKLRGTTEDTNDTETKEKPAETERPQSQTRFMLHLWGGPAPPVRPTACPLPHYCHVPQAS